jgi:serine protease Do
MQGFNSKIEKIGFGALIAALVVVASGAKLKIETNTANAGEIWTTKPVAAVSLANGVGTQTPVVTDSEIMKINRAFTDLASQMSPTVVNIYTKSTIGGNRHTARPGHPPIPDEDFEFFFGNPFEGPSLQPKAQEAQALGSGFVINTEGYIVTNAHVVRMAGHNADEIMIKFIGEDNTKGHAAKIVGVDEQSDVALLKLVEKRDGLKEAPLGDSEKSKVGEWVVAIGNPYGHSHTLTQGIVSALGRSIEGARAEFIQTSASINPGNSGGPLINMNGEVIGINAAIDPRAQGIGFAIPINNAKTVISQLMTQGRVSRPWMGVAIQDINEDIAGYMKLKNQEGVLVKEVFPNQPAARAGILAYDVIRKINGEEIHDSRELVKSVEKLGVGQTANVEVLHDNRIKNVKVLVSEQPSQASQS